MDFAVWCYVYGTMTASLVSWLVMFGLSFVVAFGLPVYLRSIASLRSFILVEHWSDHALVRSAYEP